MKGNPPLPQAPDPPLGGGSGDGNQQYESRESHQDVRALSDVLQDVAPSEKLVEADPDKSMFGAPVNTAVSISSE